MTELGGGRVVSSAILVSRPCCMCRNTIIYGSLLSIISVESLDIAEGLGDGNKTNGEQKLEVKAKGSWWKKMKKIFHRKIGM